MTTQSEVLTALNSSTDSIFITGEAGTGKSWVINHWLSTINMDRVLVCAPTGVAAINIGGETLHRAFGIPINLVDPIGQAQFMSKRIGKGKGRTTNTD